MRRLFPAVLLLSLIGMGPGAEGATSTAWETTGFADMLKGRLHGLSLTADGVLMRGPAERWTASLGQPALWSLATGPDGVTYAATGHSGKLFRIEPNGKSVLLWTAEQSEIFALALDSKGELYAGTSPNGGVYRFQNGKAQEIWHSPAKYIWSLQFARDGTLFVGTGEAGRIYRLSPGGQSDVYYETEQANVTALALGQSGQLYAGTEPNGILYEITEARHASVLYDSTLPEIRAVVAGADGSVYVAAMGGALSTRTGGTPTAAAGQAAIVTATTPTVITVTEARHTGIAAAENAQTATKTPQPSTPAPAAAASATTATVTEVAGIEKSAIYKIARDRTVETLRSSKDDNVYDLLLFNGSLLFSTDDHGRVYRLDGTKPTLLIEPGDGETTRLLQSGSRLLMALSNPGRVMAFEGGAPASAAYQSQVHDSGAVAHWGHLQWRGGETSGVTFQTRTGNSQRPDATWSPWSAPVSDREHALISSPIARFVQWRAEWSESSAGELSSVSLPYLSQNGAPTIRSITVSSIVGTNPAKAAATASSASSAYSVTVTDTGEPAPASTVSTGGQTVSRLQTTQTQVTWQADDPDSDKLVYALYFRPEEAHDWQLIRSRMSENTLLLDPDVFADGRYMFRVVASDAAANASQYAKQAELVSTSVLIDNTPPGVRIEQTERNGMVADIGIVAHDITSSLRRCEFSLDAGSWQPVEAADGITDSPEERFHIHLEKLRPGEHLLVVRVYDTAGNAGLSRVLLR